MKRLAAWILLAVMVLSGCASGDPREGLGNGWQPEKTMALEYAHEFRVDDYRGGYKLISLADGSRFLVIPEGGKLPEGIAGDIVPLYQPIENIYLAATAAMCLFDGLGRADAIRLSGTKAEGWYIDSARKAMENGSMLYAGKYSEPDYERILKEKCSLAVESTMIGHASGVKEKLEELGIPVLIDQASHESHPLGRTEWIKLYGALLNEEEKAQALFDRQVEYMEEAAAGEPTGKTVAFFYISSTGSAVVRKSGDYVSKMIELAGGEYIFHDLGDPEESTSTVNLEMETFFAAAKDADVVIYNSAISGQVESLTQLLERCPLLEQFKAVQTGDVWCTSQNMYQEILQLGQMTKEFHQVFTTREPDSLELDFLYRLK